MTEKGQLKIGEPQPIKIAASLLVKLIRSGHSAKKVLVGWTGTDEEAIEALMNGPEFLETD